MLISKKHKKEYSEEALKLVEDWVNKDVIFVDIEGYAMSDEDKRKIKEKEDAMEIMVKKHNYMKAKAEVSRCYQTSYINCTTYRLTKPNEFTKDFFLWAESYNTIPLKMSKEEYDRYIQEINPMRNEKTNWEKSTEYMFLVKSDNEEDEVFVTFSDKPFNLKVLWELDDDAEYIDSVLIESSK